VKGSTLRPLFFGLSISEWFLFEGLEKDLEVGPSLTLYAIQSLLLCPLFPDSLFG